MSQLTRTEIKGKFKRGMYPTEQDFGNAFDSYVHKDDMVELEKIVQTIDGEQKALTTIINETKDQAIAAAVEQAVAEIGKTEVPEDLTEFINKVNSFLDDADASDETINKWKEIESFLSGITDTQTLTGLLADLKAEILAETNNVSNKKFCEIIDDLDASDAEVGTIALYGGPTSDKYTHGFIYEKQEGGEGGGIVIPANNKGIRIVENDYGIPAGTYYPDLSTTWDVPIRESSNGYKALDKCFWEEGKDDVVWDNNGNYHTIAKVGEGFYDSSLKLDSTDSSFINFSSYTTFKVCKFYKEDDPTKSILGISVFNMYTSQYPNIGLGELVDVNGVVICKMSGPKYSNAFITKGVIPTNSEEIVVPTISWTPLNVMNVIN